MCPDTGPINKFNSNAGHVNLARLVVLAVLLNPMAREGPINSIESLQDVTWSMLIMVVTLRVPAADRLAERRCTAVDQHA